MKRELKFRCWTGKEMKPAFDLTKNPKYWWEENKDYPLMQYTGFKDRTGKEIYEGDIIDYVDEGSITHDFTEEVKWNKELGGWCTNGSAYVWHDVASKSKIVGNVYQNKDLLDEIN